MTDGKIRVKGRIVETQLMGFLGVLDKNHKIPILFDPETFKTLKGKQVKVIINER